jgi:hypothetical protein
MPIIKNEETESKSIPLAYESVVVVRQFVSPTQW